MTILEAINKIDELKPNSYTTNDKIEWLSIVDGMISREVIETHVGAPEVPFSGYNANTPIDTELIVPFPYDEMYLYWLESKIDYTNGEYVKYNNSVTRFHDDFATWQNKYNRDNTPLTNRINFY